MYTYVQRGTHKEKPDTSGAEIRWLRQLKGSCGTIQVPWEKQRGPIRPSGHGLAVSKKHRERPRESRAAIRSLGDGWRGNPEALGGPVSSPCGASEKEPFWA